MDHRKVAEDVVKALGADNIQAAAHCATRLRLVLKDEDKIDQEALDNNPGVKGTFSVNGQYQIIIGAGDVDKVYAELSQLTHAKETSTEELKAVAQDKGNSNPLMDFVKVLSDIFVPVLPALVGGALLMALNNVLTAEGLFGDQSVIGMYPALADLVDMVNLIASAPFAFLPVLIGFSATKRFGGNGYLGAAMGMAMVMPQLVNGYDVANVAAAGEMPFWNIFGLNVAQAGYQGSVIPVLAVSWILAQLEKFFHKKIPAAFDFTFTPMLTLIITGFLTFVLVGPVMRTVSDGLTNGLVWLYQTTGAIGLGIFGTFYSPIVITGLHQSFPAIETTLIANIARTGGSFIFPVACMANLAQGGACLAVMLMTKDEKVKNLASASSVSAMLGITEPAIFGVNLKLRFPFVCAMIASGIASAFIGYFHVLASAMGSAGLIGFISIRSDSWGPFLIGVVISLVLSFVFTYGYGRKKLAQPEAETAAVASSSAQEEAAIATEAERQSQEEAEGETTAGTISIGPAASGHYIALENVNDPVFSQKMMGDGLAIDADQGIVYAPADGEITVAYDSQHAYGIKSQDGVEILIHIGIDTVNLEGQGFESLVEQGDQVTKGQEIGKFDIEAIKAAGYDPTVMEIITNTADYQDIQVVNEGQVSLDQEVLSIQK